LRGRAEHRGPRPTPEGITAISWRKPLFSAAIRPEGPCLSSVDHGCFETCGTAPFGLRRRNVTGNILVNGFRAMTRRLGLPTLSGGCGASA
jgi:hypothetical protein